VITQVSNGHPHWLEADRVTIVRQGHRFVIAVARNTAAAEIEFTPAAGLVHPYAAPCQPLPITVNHCLEAVGVDPAELEICSIISALQLLKRVLKETCHELKTLGSCAIAIPVAELPLHS